ncbi:MAG: hypothetical protein IMZ53_03575 [Thermoplasmata archaeon]|nr:hypothetical protein [Thermoplasmata archaeon]MBE3139645.1 hypothetical protein [Thermoplasmata archaeon]
MIKQLKDKKERKNNLYFQLSEKIRFVNARSDHTCKICGQSITTGEKYIKFLERSTGWEKNACIKHYKESLYKKWQKKRDEYTKKLEKGNFIMIETDASGSFGQRWAFVVFLGKKEIFRANGFTDECGAITPAEGYAIVKGLEWLENADIPSDLPVIITNDNSAVLSKLHSGSEKGVCKYIWHRINELLDPLRNEGNLFVGPPTTSEAHCYAQKDQVH